MKFTPRTAHTLLDSLENSVRLVTKTDPISFVKEEILKTRERIKIAVDESAQDELEERVAKLLELLKA